MNVLISGGTRGIGRAMIEAFSSNGNNVAFIYRSDDISANELKNKYGALPIKEDVSDPQRAKEAATLASDALGGIDVLINNAGVSQIKMINDVTPEEYRSIIDTNLTAAYFITQSVISHMISKKSGRIINVGSMWGKIGASCETAYSASKAGLRGLTMALAKELGPSGITVNCIEPGVIDTDMNSHLSEEDLKELCDETPLGRIGETWEVAELALFLASPKASFITGQIIGIDGGFAI